MKKQLLALAFIALTGSMFATPLTPEQAIGRMMRESGRNKSVAQHLQTTPVYTAVTPQGEPAAYVFNDANGNGYRILAADDAAFTVLGYSDTGSIDPENMPPQLKWWLEETGRQIGYNVSRGLHAVSSAPNGAEMRAIAPLCTTKWNQDAPYNNECPKMSNRNTVTGCVATSMAQVMKYFNYPEKGEGTISYSWSRGGTTLSMDFEAKNFDWENMLDVYRGTGYSSTEASAVAYLMKACGYAVEMNYGTDASGTQGVLIAEALVKYFKYDGNCYPAYRMGYSPSQWNQMVYDNIANCGPVIFNGHPYNDAGHSFVCDGYDGHGYYHFNWGWGGTSDGYYLLETMNPEEQGIGGAGSTGFVYGLNGIFGIQRPTGEPIVDRPDNLLMYGGCYAEGTAKVLNFKCYPWYPQGWYSAMAHKVKVNIGAIFEPIDGTPGETVTRGGTFNGGVTVELSPGYYYNTTNGPSINVPTLPDGKYKVTLGVCDRNIKNSPYVPIITSYPCPNYIYFTLKDGEATIENVPIPKMTINNIEAASLIYPSRNVKLEVSILNETDYELSESLAAVLIQDEKVKYMGAVTPVVSQAHSNEKVEWITKFSAMAGVPSLSRETKFQLGMYDPINQQVIATFDSITMRPSIAQGKLGLDLLDIPGVEKTNETVGGQNIVVYNTPTSTFDVNLNYTVLSGYFDGYVNVNILMPEDNDLSNTVVMYDGVYRNYPFLSKDESAKEKFTVNYPDGEAGQLYILSASYKPGLRTQPLGDIYFRMKSSGLGNEIYFDAEEGVRYFNLQGIEIKEPAKGEIVIMIKDGKVSKVRF